jgi:hypothetical protein
VRSDERASCTAAPRLVPLTIGVIGHRDLLPAEVARITEQIRDVIVSYREHYPVTPILVLTSLALGADQLAVDACDGLDNVAILAVLPFSADKYESDFSGPGELAVFRHLASRSACVVVVDELMDRSSPPSWDQSPRTQLARDSAYQRCAAFVSDQSHVLIAVWDGRPPALRGGTADTVHYRLPSSEPLPDIGADMPLWPSESGILIHVPARRSNLDLDGEPPNPATDGSSIPWVVGDDWQRTPFAGATPDSVAHRIECLNERIRAEQSTEGPTRTIAETIMATADVDASVNQGRYRRRAGAVLLAGIATLMLVHIEQSFAQRWVFAPAVVALTITALLWIALSRAGAKDRFQQSRALAEGARVQSAWLAAGVRACPSDSFLQGQPEVGWIRRTLRSAWLLDQASDAAAPDPAASAYAWMRGQVDYFAGSPSKRGAVERNRATSKRYRALSVAGLVVALLGMIPDAAQSIIGTSIAAPLTAVGQAAWEFGLATAAAAAAYRHLLALDEIDRQYCATAATYRQGLLDLGRQRTGATTPLRIRAIIETVGREALRETAAWLALNRDRSVRPI